MTTSVADPAGDVDKPDRRATDKARKEAKPAERLEEYLRLMDQEGLQELEISEGAFHVKLVRQPRVPLSFYRTHPPAAAPAPQKPTKRVPTEAEEAATVKSPLAGIFYRSSSPQAAAYVKEGDLIVPGQTLCIIEAMKVMNEITSEASGRIIKIFIENGQPVQSGEKLFMLEAAE